MSKFTEGPWTFNGGDSAPILHIYAPDNKHVFHESRPLVEQEASARLIAAAPDMYEALNALFGFDAKYDGQKWNDSVKMAIAALAKARGEP